MAPGMWWLERSLDTESSERLRWNSRIQEVDSGEEDHVAGLVERIAHTMLEDDDDEKIQQANTWGGSRLPSRAQSAAEAFACFCDERREDRMNSISELSQPLQKKIENEAVKLLHTELVRLKMEELAAAQQQLALYKIAITDAGQASHSGFPSTFGHSLIVPARASLQKHGFCNTKFNRQLDAQSGRSDWSAPSIRQCGTNERIAGQRLGAPMLRPSGRYLVGLPASRESGGTGVFLPRCRTGPRSLRTHDSKRKHDFQYPVSARCPGSLPSNKTKETMANRALQYPSCSPLQEVAPDIRLPTEWTY